MLDPFGRLYGVAGRLRRRFVRPWRAPVPVLCIGNLTVGGTGKTPLTMTLARRVAARGRRPHILSRGYGGRAKGPLRVDPGTHEALAVGDEPLLLADVAPTWVARDRRLSARAAIAAGADVLIMDDGFQNPALHQDLSLVVVDGTIGFGNHRLLPAGPLREPVAEGLGRA
ncbi:MAG: tetraacyldisaccharide 4'-kinase, partial [Geminicoccaceae bacterium]|nr:tetraacyldisaccharide 4'-kinase [Geminicoccaceae bacterium]